MNTQEIKLNTQQKRAVEYGDGPLLIVAGAGTGKTTVLTQRVYHLIKTKNLKPENVLALTFTEKSAMEMEERIDRMLPYGYADLWVMTFHGFCQKILEESGINIGLPSNFRVLDETSAWMMIRKNLDKFDLDYYRPLGNPTKFIKDLIKHFSRCKDELISPEIYLDYAQKLRLNKDLTNADEAEFEIRRIEELANAYHSYQNVLLENDVLDFGDLINYTIKLLKERPNILEKYKNQFQYILVDEFQDTNYAQYELIKILANTKNNITVVGDDDQSIYAFRGSSMNNILGFKKDYKNAQEIFITDNYRSTQDILDLAYGFIELNNPNRLEIKLAELSKNKKEKLDKKLKSHSEEKGEIDVIVSDTEEDEAHDVLEKIYEIMKEKADLSWNDFAILVRSNSQAKPFIRALDDAGIPYNFVASSGLYEKEIIMDIMSYLKLLDDYHESTALWRILNLKFFDINHKDLVNLSHTAKKKAVSLYEVIKNHFQYIKLTPKTIKILDEVVASIEKHTKMSLTQKVWIVIWEFLNDSGYLKYIDSLKESEKQEIFSHLNQFYKKVKNFERDDINGKVKDFLEFFTLETESGDKGKLQSATDDGPESVKIMTVHGSKGLEFDYVFICGLVDKRFPSIERSETIPIPDDLVKEQILEGDVHLEEERRLFYVAMTRARKGLYFTRAKDYGGVKAKKPSRFLQELNLVKMEEEFISDNASFYDKFSKRDDVRKIDKTDLKKLLPKQYSFSQIAAYDSCPRQYYYAHILKIPSMGKHVFSFGKSMHLALQKFFQLHNARISIKQDSLFEKKNIDVNKLSVSQDELIKIYEENFIDDWYEDEINKKKYFELGKKLLRELYKKYENNPPKVKYLEKGFNIKLADYSFKGNIDRVDVVPGGVELVDYKTGKPKSKLTFEEKQQLIIYQIAYENVFEEKVKNLKFYYLDDNSEIDFIGSAKDTEKAQNKVLEVVKKINSCDFKPTPSEHTCKYCDFNKICPFRE